MQAWVFSAASQPQVLVESALPSPGPGETLVRLTAATICGSDLHTISGTRLEPGAPLVLGHEGVGVVVAVGAAAAAAAADEPSP